MDKMKKVKKKRKMAKNLTLPHWDSNPTFLNKTFPPKIWILRVIRPIELTVLKKSWLYGKDVAHCITLPTVYLTIFLSTWVGSKGFLKSFPPNLTVFKPKVFSCLVRFLSKKWKFLVYLILSKIEPNLAELLSNSKVGLERLY